MTTFKDGTSTITGCRCSADCGMPCWQRIGISPACEDCGCAPFTGDDEHDRADELRAMPDIWPAVVEHLSAAALDPADAIENGLGVSHADLEAKFRKGEAEHDRDWLDMTREQIEAEIHGEWLDLVIYYAMLRARFSV